ncbi:MAG: hypothetical protein NVSMB51_16700 [Solirubrobacteraceae bacterium]
MLEYARARLGRVSADVWLDSLIVGLGSAAVASAVIFKLVDPHPHDLPAVITSLVYPLEDVALLGLLVGVGAALSWRLSRGGVFVAAAIVLITAGDASLFPRLLSGGDASGAWANFGWTAGIGLLAAGAWRDTSSTPLPEGPHRLGPAVAVAFSVVAIAVVTLGRALDLTQVATMLAAAALLLSVVRLYRSFVEIRSLADSRRLALTDELTDLPNRRHLQRDLDRAFRRGAPHLLALFDLDGFKRFNDAYGHNAGDRLLAGLAARLVEATEPHGVAYRLGGDEFCLLLEAGELALHTISAAAEALTARTPEWSLTVSFGVVELPGEAADPSAALRIADRRLYGQKDRRPAAARQQARDVLLSALGEQQPALRAHVKDVTFLAGDVARQLGMAPEEIDDVIRAAELHDVGKIAVPRDILEKPEALNAAEWDVMRRHTIIGERMLAVAPALRSIAPLVRSSHERWDGGGYPDGLAGESIPIGSRIVAVCDSFDAMTVDRPYRRGMPQAQALAELRCCAGSQFDPRVVEAFMGALERAEQAT